MIFQIIQLRVRMQLHYYCGHFYKNRFRFRGECSMQSQALKMRVNVIVKSGDRAKSLWVM